MPSDNTIEKRNGASLEQSRLLSASAYSEEPSSHLMIRLHLIPWNLSAAAEKAQHVSMENIFSLDSLCHIGLVNLLLLNEAGQGSKGVM